MNESLKKSFVPRHRRFAPTYQFEDYIPTHEVLVEIPVTDDSGKEIGTELAYKPVPCDEALAQYTPDMFKLNNLLAAGVPLSVVNVNRSKMYELDKVVHAVDSIEQIEAIQKRIEIQNAERQSWLQPVNDDNNDNN